MQYDIATKRLLEMGKEEIVKTLLGIKPGSLRFIKALPTESPSLRSSDYPMLVREAGRRAYILVLEVQSYWKREKVLSLADYWVRFKDRYPSREVKPCMVLLTGSGQASDFFQDEYLTFRFHLIKLWDLEAIDYLNSGVEVMPLIPLMKGGLDLVLKAENRIYYEESLSIDAKGDLLTALSIFTGLKDKKLTKNLISRRRDIMIESAAYEIIKKEGKEEGLQEGIQKGKLEGRFEGKLETARNFLGNGVTLEIVLKSTGLSAEQLKAAGILTD